MYVLHPLARLQALDSSHHIVLVAVSSRALHDKTPASILMEGKRTVQKCYGICWFWGRMAEDWAQSRTWGRPSWHWGLSLHIKPSLPSQKDPLHLNDVVCRLVQAHAVELQAWCVVAGLIAFFDHCLHGWQVGTTGPWEVAGYAPVWEVGFPTGEGPCLPEDHWKWPSASPGPQRPQSTYWRNHWSTWSCSHSATRHTWPGAAANRQVEREAGAPSVRIQKRPLEPVGQVCGKNMGDYGYRGCLEERRAKTQGLGH